MSASRRKRSSRRRRKVLRAVSASPIDTTWDRICSWDDVRRRSAWMRVVFWAGAPENLQTRSDIERIEVRAGREGDDLVFVIDHANPQLHELYDLFCTMRFVVEHSRDPGW